MRLRGYHAGFKWESIYGAASVGDSNALAYKGDEVARMSDKVGGGWLALLRFPDGRTVHRECSSYVAGRAGIEAWAERRLGRRYRASVPLR